MHEDPIVKEVRKFGEIIAKKSNYNVHLYFKNLRQNEFTRGIKVVKKISNGNANKRLSIIS